jgi:lysophospholipase L1-like esterase
MTRILRRAGRVFLFSLYTLVAALILLECLVRFIRPAPPFEAITVTTGDDCQYSLIQNERLIYAPRPNTGAFNAQGYRGPIVPYQKPEGTKRILFMGDSVAEGLGVDASERFSTLLERRLSDTHDVVNLAVRGYNLVQEIEYLKLKGLPYHPDLVLFGITYNDLELNSGELDAFDRRLQDLRYGAFFRAFYQLRADLFRHLFHLHTFRHLHLILERRGAAAQQPIFSEQIYYRLKTDEVKRELRQLAEISRERSFRLGFIILPVDTARDQIRIIKASLSEMSLPALDLDDALERGDLKIERGRAFLPDDACHLSPSGHAAVADALVDWIRLLAR